MSHSYWLSRFLDTFKPFIFQNSWEITHVTSSSGCKINKAFHSFALGWALVSVLFLVTSNPSFHWRIVTILSPTKKGSLRPWARRMVSLLRSVQPRVFTLEHVTSFLIELFEGHISFWANVQEGSFQFIQGFVSRHLIGSEGERKREIELDKFCPEIFIL